MSHGTLPVTLLIAVGNHSEPGKIQDPASDHKKEAHSPFLAAHVQPSSPPKNLYNHHIGQWTSCGFPALNLPAFATPPSPVVCLDGGGV